MTTTPTRTVDLEIRYTLDGKPTSWARARTGAGRYFMPVKVTAAKKAHAVIAEPLAEQAQWDPTWPVSLTVDFFFPVAASWPKWKKEAAEAEELPHVYKPDLDNLIKLVKDALGTDTKRRKSIVWKDDCLVTRVRASKWYSARPRTEVVIERA